jgi:hypothetical protein
MKFGVESTAVSVWSLEAEMKTGHPAAKDAKMARTTQKEPSMDFSRPSRILCVLRGRMFRSAA